MFSKVEKFRLFPSRRRVPAVITPANDNRVGARQSGAPRRCPPRLTCRWSEIDGAKRLACRWGFENPDGPSYPAIRCRPLRFTKLSSNCLIGNSWWRGVEQRPDALRGCACAIEWFDCVARTSLDDAI